MVRKKQTQKYPEAELHKFSTWKKFSYTSNPWYLTEVDRYNILLFQTTSKTAHSKKHLEPPVESN